MPSIYIDKGVDIYRCTKENWKTVCGILYFVMGFNQLDQLNQV